MPFETKESEKQDDHNSDTVNCDSEARKQDCALSDQYEIVGKPDRRERFGPASSGSCEDAQFQFQGSSAHSDITDSDQDQENIDGREFLNNRSEPSLSTGKTKNIDPVPTSAPPQSQQATSTACGNSSSTPNDSHQAIDSDAEEATTSCCGAGRKKKKRDSYREGFRDTYILAYKEATKDVYSSMGVRNNRNMSQLSAMQHPDSSKKKKGGSYKEGSRDAYVLAYRDGFRDAIRNIHSSRGVSNNHNMSQPSAGQHPDSSNPQHGASSQFQPSSRLSDVSSHESVSNMAPAARR